MSETDDPFLLVSRSSEKNMIRGNESAVTFIGLIIYIEGRNAWLH